ANSEHCRHKIFNAQWVIDGQEQSETLFGMIRATHAAQPQGTVVAYSDNSAIMQGGAARVFYAGLPQGAGVHSVGAIDAAGSAHAGETAVSVRQHGAEARTSTTADGGNTALQSPHTLYRTHDAIMHTLMKVETHNHP